MLAMSSFNHNDNDVAGCSVTTAVGVSDVDADAADDSVIISIARMVASTACWQRSAWSNGDNLKLQAYMVGLC